jgi:hypothetical protein
VAGRKRTPNGKRTREILAALPEGYSIVKDGRRDHLRVLRPDGEPLRDGRGLPVLVAGTSSCNSTGREVARIRRAIRAQA